MSKLLRRGGRRGYKRRRGVNRLKIPNRVDISERPQVVNDRQRYGDWEADLIEGTKQSGYMLSLIERKSRFGILFKLSSKKSDHVAQSIVEALQGYQVLTITYDNGTEFAKHEVVNGTYGCESFFCKPYASWEKGGVENFNGRVRVFFPKKFLFTGLTQEVRQVAKEINKRPMEVLANDSPLDLEKMILKECPSGLRPLLLVDSSSESEDSTEQLNISTQVLGLSTVELAQHIATSELDY